MTAYNVVRMRVKPGKNEEYIAAHKRARPRGFPRHALGRDHPDRRARLLLIGEWDSMDAIVTARPAMIGTLDKARALLEDLGGGLGVTDPVSGEVVLEMHPEVA